MKIDRRNLIIACILVLVAGVLTWLYWSGKPKPAGAPEPGRTSTSTPVVPSTPVDKTNQNVAVPLVTPTREEIKERQKNKIMSLYATSIAVYGKVVDEAGNPVPAATVEIGIADKPLQTGSKYKQTTDGNGLFSLTGVRGIAFSLSASKDGYYTTNESTGHRNVVVPVEGDTPQSSKDKPVVLVLHKQGKTEALITGKSGQIIVPKTGQPVSIDLATGQVGQGGMQIASWVGDNNQQRYDWRYQLSIPGGGLVERKGQFNFEAPTDGYQSNAEVNMPATAEKWSISADRDYFAKLSDGRYARFSIRFYPRKRSFVVIESYVNPTPGNRNLEFDPKKVVESP